MSIASEQLNEQWSVFHSHSPSRSLTTPSIMLSYPASPARPVKAIHAALHIIERSTLIPASDGKSQIKTFQGRTVIVDDACPVRDGTTDGKVYTTYLFGRGVFAKGNASLNDPVEGGVGTRGVELSRTALASDSVLINRRRYILHPRGVKFNSASVAGDSPTNAELETAANWTRVWEAKNVRLVAVTHNN